MQQYAVIGHPIHHSLSPVIHQEFAKQFQLSLEYIKIDAQPEQFAEKVREFQRAGGKGMNITLPFKERAYQLADQHSELATQAKAANTFIFRDAIIYAESTDGKGLTQDLTINHNFSIKNKKLLILGAGGAVRTILGPLLALQPTQLILANRTIEKAQKLVEEFKKFGHLAALTFAELPNHFDLIINATSAGLTGTPLDLPTHLVTQSTWCYDLMYEKNKTSFLQWAQRFNPANCLDGIGMLVEQAAISFYLWHNKHPQTQPVITKLRSSV